MPVWSRGIWGFAAFHIEIARRLLGYESSNGSA